MGDGTAGSSRLARFVPDTFVLLMLGAVALALLWPAGGVPGGPLRLEVVTPLGIALVFFLHGANLAPRALYAGFSNWRVHLLVQGATFVMFPVLGFALFAATRTLLPQALGLGFFFLAALPSTISSSVAMTALGRGNVPAAVFNASLSGLIGMIVTPLLLGLLGSRATGHIDVGHAIGDIALTLLLPFALGQVSRPLTAGFIARHKAWLGRLDRGVILLIVYGSFASSTASGTWSQFEIADFVVTAVLVLALLAVALTLTRLIARSLGLSRADEVTAVFCGSKKSLANGAPMAQILFAGSASMGLLMLPLMLYHQAQLMVCAVLARRYALAAEREGDPQ